ncbi:hypothetical protein HPP92_019830 [Vanilla planifolia]|uniref:Dof zinc finger protein n=1 Tax=Vanilla planifolia TaxID=51239 RepID=A0A835Q040_VANPL|nr:hypothetical protein HPP92_019830 [Vanilla planifolia]
MVFTSLPAYLDQPNWNQQQITQLPGSNSNVLQLPTAVEQPPPPGGQPGQARPVSMSERARLAKIPQPEAALKCPRCDSTNTKFCYFNNYSLSQPRHFCKTCRRYWTRGGALRNVPVGGGCRRNKRSKSASSSKSSTSSAGATASALAPPLPPPPPQHFAAPFPSPGDYPGSSIGHSDYQGWAGLGLGLEQWRMQHTHQFSFDASSPAPAPGLFSFDGDNANGFSGCLIPKPSGSALPSPPASVKTEDASHIELNLRRQHLTLPGNNDPYWPSVHGGGGWPGDLTGFNSLSSSRNML